MLTGAILLFGDAEKGPLILRLLGRLHPGFVHFPIALLTLAAILETWQIMRRKPTMAQATPLLLVLGAVSAVIASMLGWFLNEYDANREDNLFILHMYIGFAASGVAILAAVFVTKAPHSKVALFALRGLLFASAGLIGATGYLGGDLLYGANHLFKGIFDQKTEVPNNGNGTDSKPPDQVPPVAGKVDFKRDIAPILTDNCLRCHGGEKKSGKLDLKTFASAKKGGSDGPGFVPGKPDESRLYTLLIEQDLDAKMPPPKQKQLSKEQIELVRKWIAEGAEWPNGFELKWKE